VRVVAGAFKGRPLHAPKGLAVRPTPDRVREALFSILGPMDGLRVLDLFAGTGALGIEALSRGAASAVFLDSDRRAVDSIRRNLDAVGGPPARVRRQSAGSFLAREAAVGERYDLVFADPPYSSAGAWAARLSELLPPVCATDARIVTESAKRSPLHLSLPLELERAYGDTRIAIHRVTA
jgi:16S rRNA (guanine966-N2)-methyltransferase